MTDSTASTPALQPNTLQLYDNVRPGLEAGTYTIKTVHELKVDGADIPGASQPFTVKGPRFTLEPADVHAVYPPANSSGHYGDTLPHVVLGTRTLPWERFLAGQAETVPWLALLVLDAADVATAPASPTGAVAMKVSSLVSGGGDDLRVPNLQPSPDEQDVLCQALEIPAKLFLAVAPRLSELSYLAHVRQINVSAQPGAAPGEVGWFAVVVANRLPTATAGGAKSIVHLVSYEGQEDLLGSTPDSVGDANVRLVSLASWSFSTTPDTNAAGESFAQLSKTLATARTGERADLALGLPFADASKLPPEDPNRRVSDRLADGYVPVGYHLPTGENTFAWYRGPLTPRTSGAVAPGARPFRSSSAALVYDEDTGLFDISLATAWELGRAMALADRKFTVELVRLRRAARRVVDLVLAGLRSKHVSTADLDTIVKGDVIEQRFLDLLGQGLIATVAKMSSGKSSALPSPTQADNDLPPDEVAAIKALLEREDVQALVAKEVAADLEPITEWLTRLTSLQGMPFVYLVPHPEVLPVESVRFFTLDPNWIAALVDGALSLGVQSSRDSWFQKLMPTIGPVQPYASTVTGLVMRSAIVAGWPGLTVEAGTGTNGQDEQPSTLVRSDRLAPNVLLCLFAGTPDRIQLRLPHQGLHFALENGWVYFRTVDGPTGKPLDVAHDQSLWRAGADRVLNIAAPKNGNSVDLVSRIVGKDGLDLDPKAEFGAADFALQMLSAPEELTFALP